MRICWNEKKPCHRTIDIIDCQIAFSVRNCMSTEIMNLSDHPLFHRSPFYISLNETAGNCATEWCHHALGPTNWNLQSLSLPLGLRNLGPCQAVKNLHHAMDFLWLCIMLICWVYCVLVGSCNVKKRLWLQLETWKLTPGYEFEADGVAMSWHTSLGKGYDIISHRLEGAEGEE